VKHTAVFQAAFQSNCQLYFAYGLEPKETHFGLVFMLTLPTLSFIINIVDSVNFYH